MSTYPNVVLLTIDALRSDHLGCRKTTPYIDRLVKKGVSFSHAFANGPTTPFSFPSILASVYPFQIDGIGLPHQGFKTIAEVLGQSGYSTAGFSPNDFVSRIYNYDRGFDTFIDLQNWSAGRDKARRQITGIVKQWPKVHQFARAVSRWLPRGDHTFTEWNAESILSQAAQWLRERDSSDSFFLWCHFNDVHHPWEPRPSYLEHLNVDRISPKRAKKLVHKLLDDPDDVWSNVTPREMQTAIDLYDAALAYTDERIDQFIKTHIDLDQTLVIITSDHGEEFGEHGGFHRNKPYDEMLHVPLIMAGLDLPEGTIIDSQVPLIDLPPTIVELCGLSKVEELRGISLVPLIAGDREDRTVIASYNRRLVEGKSAPEGEVFIIRENGWKFILRENGDELYDTRSDTQEKDNLLQQQPQVAQNLKIKLMKHISQFEQSKIPIEEALLDEAVQDRLRALGYIE
ncbi:MAG: sulfatase [Planctomycetes bacterium]|nr:sulfatase [Planctomycetota bacterium]